MPIAREEILSCGGCASKVKTLLNQSNNPNDQVIRDGFTSNGVALVDHYRHWGFDSFGES